MMNVVLNESEIIKNALEGKYDKNNIVTTLNLLLKHYYISEMVDKLQLREQLLTFLKNNYEGYKRAKWEETVTKMVERFLKTVKKNKIDVKIIDVNEVKITKNELERISFLDNIKLEKMAFVMLIYAKISNITMNTNESWINKSSSMICKEAKVNLKGIEKEKMLNELYNLGYIQQRKHNAKTNMKICYINEDSETEIIIDNFIDVVYYYILWKDKSLIRCERCRKPIKPKSNREKYCDKCFKEVRKEQVKINVQNLRKRQDVIN